MESLKYRNAIIDDQRVKSDWHICKKRGPSNEIILFNKQLTQYMEPVYETYIKKETGEEIQMSRINEMRDYVFNEDDIEVTDRWVQHKIFRTSVDFQYNLRKYIAIIPIYASKYNFVWSIIPRINTLYIGGRVYQSKEGRFSDYWMGTPYHVSKTTGWYPLLELCFMAGNGTPIYNYIPDDLFFNYENRAEALNNILHGPMKKELIDVGYVNMSDDALLKYMNKRFSKYVEFSNTLQPLVNVIENIY